MAPCSFHSVVLAFAVSLLPTLAFAQSDPELELAARQYLSDQARSWLESPIIVDAVNEQNRSNAGLSRKDIDPLDKQWRREAEAGSGPMIDRLLSNALSVHLMSVQKQTSGLVTEIFVMDNKGLNVGQSSVTSDFWQGDESKWQRAFLLGPTTLFVDEVEFDDSSQRFQVQVSVPVVDPASGKAIGVVTIGIDAEGLLMM